MTTYPDSTTANATVLVCPWCGDPVNEVWPPSNTTGATKNYVCSSYLCGWTGQNPMMRYEEVCR